MYSLTSEVHECIGDIVLGAGAFHKLATGLALCVHHH